MRVRVRFWLETGLGILSAVLALVTVIHRTWIETVFGVDPDQHNGSAEWLIVAVALAITVTSVTLARQEWRRRQTATA